MPPRPEHLLLALDQIDQDDTTYLIRPEGQTAPSIQLIDSIRQYGILHPPLVQQAGQRYRILSGRMRIAAAQSSGLNFIPCQKIDDDADPDYLAGLILEHARSGSELSPVQLALFLWKVCDNLSQSQKLALLARAGMKAGHHQLDTLKQLLSFETPLLAAVHEGWINLKNARKLFSLDQACRQVVVELIEKFQLGGSKQRKLIETVLELSGRGQDVLRLLHPYCQPDTSREQPENRPQQAAELLARLEKQCRPHLMQAEEEFKQFRASLHLPGHAVLSHTPSFEDDTVTLSLQFPDREHLVDFCERLHALWKIRG